MRQDLQRAAAPGMIASPTGIGTRYMGSPFAGYARSLGRRRSSVASANSAVPKTTKIMRMTAAFHSIRHLRRAVALEGERDQMRDSVANKDHRGEAACDDREKKTSCDGVLHREGPQSKVVPGLYAGNGGGEKAGTRSLGKSDYKLPPEV
jgi:hypothetical protein